MKYHIATRTRRQMFSYSVCDNLEDAKVALKRYGHVWRVGVYQQDEQGYITRLNLTSKGSK